MENKLGITDKAALADAEERIAKKCAVDLFDKGTLGKLEVGTFKGLKDIHCAVYGDIYPNAGEKRTVEVYKGKARFTSLAGLDTGLNFASIMPDETLEDIIDKYIEMNIVHPFRTGNIPALCIWLNVMLSKKLGVVVDWSKVDERAFNDAMEVCGVDDTALHDVLKNSFSKNLGRDMYVRGVDAIFAFAGFNAYKAADLLDF